MSQCRTCRFYAATGECRRHAPRALVVTTDGRTDLALYTAWPETAPTDWCGEWESEPAWPANEEAGEG